MKRRVLSILLVLAMMVGSIGVLPINAADHSANFGMKVVGVEDESKEGLTMSIFYKGSDLVNVQSIFLSVDASKLALYGLETGAPVTITETRAKIASSVGSGKNAKAVYDPWTDSDYFYALEADGRQLLLIQLGFDSGNDMATWDPQDGENAAWGEVMQFYLKYQDGVDGTKLDKNSIKLLDNTHAAAKNESAIIVMKSVGTGDLYYGSTNTALYENNIGSAIFEYPNCKADGPAATLTGITFDIDKDDSTNKITVNGTTGGSVAVSNVKPVPADADLGDVTWTVSGPAGAKGVTINANTGAVTVAKDATAGQYTINAKSSSVTGTAKTFTVERAPAAAKTLTVSATDKTAVYGTAKDITPTFAVKDQYGDNVTSPTITMDTATGFSFNGTKVTVANNATVGKHTLTFKCGTASATLEITVNKKAGPAAPTGLGKVDAQADGTGGKITGTTTAMEYAEKGKNNWQECSATETAVAPGTYVVRTKVADANTQELGATTEITVGQAGKSATPTVTVASDKGATPAEGAEVTLTANVTSDKTALVYQWTKNGTDIPGATNATYVISSMSAADNGTYNVKVKNTETGKGQSDEGTAATGVTLEMKPVPTVTLARKTTEVKLSSTTVKASDLFTATVSEGTAPNLDTLLGAQSTWAEKGLTVTFYEYVPAVPDDDKTPDINESKPAELKVVTTLERDKTYYVDAAMTAGTVGNYKVAVLDGVGTPADAEDATLAKYIKVVVSKASSSGGGGGSSTTRYTVTYDAGEHGKLDGAATERVESGKNPAKVPSVVADKGYKFVGWTLNGKSVDPTSQKITAATKFVAEYEAADKVTYIQGMDKNHFQPAGNATRGQLATMLARLSKDYDASKTYTGKAPDVENGKWYSNAVNFAINQGIMNGFEDGMFRPTENIRRGEFAAMLARYLGLNTSSKAHFADVTDHWAAGYINALADAGIVDGFEDGTFKAQNLLTRAEAVKMINLAVEMKYDEKADYDNSFVDVAQGAWYYEFVMPAANLDVTDYQR